MSSTQPHRESRAGTVVFRGCAKEVRARVGRRTPAPRILLRMTFDDDKAARMTLFHYASPSDRRTFPESSSSNAAAKAL